LILLLAGGVNAMPRATDQQVQQYVNERLRVRAEQFRALRLAVEDDKAVIDDVYEHVSGANAVASTWTDVRTDGPPHLVTANDVLAYNTFLDAFLAFCDPDGNTAAIAAGADQLPVLADACVRPVDA
jgi:hypothetical protein